MKENGDRKGFLQEYEIGGEERDWRRRMRLEKILIKEYEIEVW